MEDKRLTLSKNALYNTIGTIVFCFCQWLISSFLVVRLSPEDMAVSNTGLLQLAISVTNIFFSISCYNMRTYQISDTKGVYSDGDYIGMRFVTAAIAVLLCVAYVAVLGYPLKSILCIAFYMIFKLNETFSDVLHAIDQKNYRMDYVGISYCIRGAVMTVVFALTLLFTGDVMISVVAMAAATVLVVALYDCRVTSRFGSLRPRFDKKTISLLLITCLPTVIASASFTAVTTVPRQMLEGMQGEEALGFYGTVATPVLIVQIMATSIFNPMLTQLSEFYSSGRVREFVSALFKNLLILAVITAAVLIGIALLGEFAVGLVFGEKFVPYTYLMYGIMGCTALYTVCWLCSSVLIIMRRLKVYMVASVVSLGTSALLAKTLIKTFGMDGVSICVIICYVIYIAICTAVISRDLKIKGKES